MVIWNSSAPSYFITLTISSCNSMYRHAKKRWKRVQNSRETPAGAAPDCAGARCGPGRRRAGDLDYQQVLPRQLAPVGCLSRASPHAPPAQYQACRMCGSRTPCRRAGRSQPPNTCALPAGQSARRAGRWMTSPTAPAAICSQAPATTRPRITDQLSSPGPHLAGKAPPPFTQII